MGAGWLDRRLRARQQRGDGVHPSFVAEMFDHKDLVRRCLWAQSWTFFQPVVGSSDVAGSKISGAILKQFTEMFKQNIRGSNC